MKRVIVGLCVASFFAGPLVAGCGGAHTGAFGLVYPDNDDAAIAEVAARLRASAGSGGSAVAVGITSDAVYAYDLAEGRELWRQAVQDPRTAPSIAGRLVVLQEGERIIARRLADGSRAFDMPDDRLHLIGAAGDGDLAAIVLSTAGGVGAESRVYLVRGDGIAAHYELDHPVGVPAVAAGMVFVPWGHQQVSVIDGQSGQEIARVRSLAGVVSQAEVFGGQVYFGQSGVGRMAAGAGAGSAEEVGWSEPSTAELPGAPPLWRSAYDPPSTPTSATHRVRIDWAPQGESGAVGWVDDTLYLTFYSMVFALAPDLTVRWLHQHDHDIVGADVRAGGLLIADNAGGFAFLTAREGSVSWESQSSGHPTAVTLRLGAFNPPVSSTEERPFLAEQLLAAAQSTDDRLLPARAFAVNALGATPDAAVTGHLLVLCEDASVAPPLRSAACEQLASRDSGADIVLRALRRHGSYLEDVTPPPVGPLATAAARMREATAVPLLLAHLSDPYTSTQDIVPLANALAALGDHAASGPLTDFLWLYHADQEEHLDAGLVAVARALITLSGPPGREEVESVMQAPFTPNALRGMLRDALEARDDDEHADDEGDGAADD